MSTNNWSLGKFDKQRWIALWPNLLICTVGTTTNEKCSLSQHRPQILLRGPANSYSISVHRTIWNISQFHTNLGGTFSTVTKAIKSFKFHHKRKTVAAYKISRRGTWDSISYERVNGLHREISSWQVHHSANDFSNDQKVVSWTNINNDLQQL